MSTEGSDHEAKTWLLHLSDIHFRKVKNHDYDPYDLDADLRDQLERDVQSLRRKIGASFTGIVVSGDVAFAGKHEEFERAEKWLRKLAGLCGCPPENVFCVPGNHDADRSVFDESLLVKKLHSDLKSAKGDSVDDLLAEAIRDKEASKILFRPLAEYNKFAAKFQCTTAPEAIAWEHRLPMNDGSLLVLRGANSVLASNKNDDNKAHKLVLGSLQATPTQRDNEAVVLVCHHPPDWLLDYDEVLPLLNHRIRVQLYGHKHKQTIDRINNSVKVVAGAVHPDRREAGWRPRYNCLGFSVRNEMERRELMVDIYPRIWAEGSPEFQADFGACAGSESVLHAVKLPMWEGEDLHHSRQVEIAASSREDGDAPVNPARTLTFHYLSLPHAIRMEIAQELELIRDEDEGVSDSQLFERILVRAGQGNRLADLWDEVAAHHTQLGMKNPYRKKDEE